MHQSVTVRERAFEAQLPALDIREELVLEFGARRKRGGVPFLRICAAMIGLCLGEIAFALRIPPSGARADLSEYGGAVYCALKEKGWTVADIVSAGTQLLNPLVDETFPREPEVEAARKNSGGGAAS